MELPKELRETVEIFQELSDQERLEELVRLGKALEPFPEEAKTEDNQVVECLSDTFILVEKREDDRLHIRAYAEPAIVKGVLTLILQLLNGRTPEEVVKSESTIRRFVKDAKLNVSTIPSRINTVMGVVELIRRKAKKLR